MSSHKQNLERAIALVGLYLKSGKTEEALRLLQRVKRKFLESGVGSIWAFWHAQALVAHGEPEKALEEARDEKDPHINRTIRMIALREIGRRSGEWHPYAEHLERCFEETQQGEFLFELCQLKEHLKDWPYVADRAEALIRHVGTAEALRMAVYAAWEARRPQQCLGLLNENHHFFPSHLLPADLGRLRVLCQARLGLLSQAVADAEALVSQEDTTENVLTLMDVQLLKGDLKGLTITARRLIARDDMAPINLLRAARLTLFEDHGMAKEFWSRARERALDDPTLLNEALTLGFRLGLDAEMAPLIMRMQDFVSQGRGSFQAFNIKELLPIMRDRAEYSAHVAEKYSSGEVPIHLVAKELSVPLARVFHALPEQNRKASDPLSQPIIWVRHGGRPLQQGLTSASNSWRLHLDVTAMLLAADLGILEKVEQCFAPLRISPGLLAALVHQRDMLASHQPSRLASYRRILQLQQDGKLQPMPAVTEAIAAPAELVDKMGADWTALLEKAMADDGFIVDYLPLTSNNLEVEPITLPDHNRHHVINCRALIERLRHAGYFSESTYQEALRALGSEGIAEVPALLPAIDSKVFLMANIAGVLADARLLESVCRHYKVFVDRRFLDEAHLGIEEEEHRSELAVWLAQLIDHVRTGLDADVYQSIIIPDDKPRPELDGNEADNPDALSLLTFLQFQPRDSDVIWADDRWFNGHAHRDGVPIIGINEVLRALWHRGYMQESEYYAALLKLRAANCRYIPLEKEEILHHLQQAQVIDEAIVETEELSILRRYIAACLLDSTRLQRPPMPERAANPHGEIAFVAGTVRAVTDAIIAGWSDEQFGDDIAQARADWILNNLHTGLLGVRHLRHDPDPDSDGLDLIGLEIGGVLSQSFTLRGRTPNKQGEEGSPRRTFFDWLESRIISQRFKADPDAVVAVADHLKNLLTEVLNRHYDDQKHEIVARLLIQQFFFDLPEGIQDAIQLDPEVMAGLGVTTFRSITVGSLCFERDEFVKAAADAVNGRLCRITAREPEDEFTFICTIDNSAGQHLIEIRNQQGTVVTTFRESLLGFLLDNPKTREEWLRSHRTWFDCPTDEFEKTVADIASTEQPQDRVEKAMGWRKASAAVFYENLERQLKDSGQFSPDDLFPPSAEGLLRHFRLDTLQSDETDVLSMLQRAATALISEEGVESAVERMGCLPVRLPPVLWEEFDKLSNEEKRGLIRKLSTRCASPVSKIHLIDLSLRYGREEPDLPALARSTLTELFDESAGELHYRLFAALLNYVNDEFGYWADTVCWQGPIKLAMVWAHSNILYNLFTRLQLDPDRLAQWFERVRRRTSAEILGRELASWNDVLHPRWQNRTNFLVHAVAYIVSSYDSQVIEDLGISDLLVTTAFTGDDESRSPQISLLRDPTLASNALDSFLGGDLSTVLAPCVGHELSSMLASPSLKNMVERAIHNLKSDPLQQSEWVKIAVVVGNLLMYEDLAAEFKKVVRQLNFRSLDMINPSTAMLALRVASDQVVRLKDEAFRLHCETGLLEIIKAQGNRDNGSANPDIDLFLDDALDLSIRPGDVRATSKAFSKLLQDMFDAWPGLASRWRPGLSMLVRELPARQLHGIWPLVLQMRARDHRA